MHKILVIQTAFIGDAVLATGILESLHQAYPDAAIDFMVRKGNESLLEEHPFLHQVLVWNKKEKKYANWWQLLLQIRKEKYDVIINVQRFAATGLLTVLGGAKKTIGFDKNPLSFLFYKKVTHQVSNTQHPIHEIARNHLLIADLVKGVPCKPKLYPTESQYSKIEKYTQAPYITISPASVWFTKQFPAGQWVRFMNELPPTVTIYLLGGPNDATLCTEIANKSTHSGIKVLAGQLSFLESAALMKTAVMNYVNDSAPMHFASSLDAPVTAVYCSTLPSFGFGPLSSRQFIVETKVQLDCRPCGLHGKAACPQGHFNCARSIETSQLLATLSIK